MSIILTIVNADALRTGAEPTFRASGRGFVIGRESGTDWTLPDPTRHVSSRHCEVRFADGAYWLRDVSTNGVFLNGSDRRLAAPHRLVDGDRLAIGRYLIRVALSPASGAAADRPARGHAATPGRPDIRRLTLPGGGQNETPGPFTPSPARTGAPHQPQPTQSSPRDDGFLEAFCAGAGLPPDIFAGADRRALARDIGAFVRITAEQVGELLKYRASAKALTKSASRTVIGTADNNPLKFVPDAGDAIDVMFARRRPGYLDARRAIEDSFADLKTHEAATYAAMQKALGRLLDQIDPAAIDARLGGGFAFASRKERAWDLFVQRWEERSAGENGMLDAFLAYFAEAYDEASRRK